MSDIIGGSIPGGTLRGGPGGGSIIGGSVGATGATGGIVPALGAVVGFTEQLPTDGVTLAFPVTHNLGTRDTMSRSTIRLLVLSTCLEL